MNNFNDGTAIKEIEDTVEAAQKAAYNILNFSDNTVNQLREKLLAKGYSESSCEGAIKHCVEHGHIKEADHLARFIEICAGKFYGRRRIYMEAKARGFDSDLIKERFDKCIENIDFDMNCAKLISRLIAATPSLATDMNKLIATVMRYGYSIEEIRAGYKLFSTKRKKLK